MRWDPAQYSRFSAERDRPFFDLTSRIFAVAPRHIVDIGCGQGHLTATLAERWPQAIVEGFDSSPEMIADAAGIPGVTFRVADAAEWQPAADVDVIVSNAALHWVPQHQQLLARWSSVLPSGGWVAVQVPGNFDSPSHTLMRRLACSDRWADRLEGAVAPIAVGSPTSYAEVLLAAGLDADVWETTYIHVLHGEDPVLEWIRGTGLRPILAALSASDAPQFVAELGAELRQAYPPGPHGTLFPFRRVFA
ncbi:MAG: trans-aconitate 2-methyltransferase, partial [Mycobacteriaceae bacterium]|nr:trans-aconitate 2-methyltransferase [Mycobacteriaceae bacterium]